MQTRAIVRIVDGAWVPDASVANTSLCSGAFVTATWVLSAAHCLAIVSPAVAVEGDDGAVQVLPVLRTERHPTADVALLEIDSAALGTSMEPFGVGTPSVDGPAVGTVAELAGYGLTETDSWGELRFAIEPVVASDATSWTLDGEGASGACLGDSGGPLLVRGAAGAPVVVGVLSSGSATCVNQDLYARVDVLQAWIEDTTGPFPAPSTDCGQISNEGRCFPGRAVWCAASQLTAESCVGGSRCGWTAAASGYRCVAPALDPCDGTDGFGSCRGRSAVACIHGTQQSDDCGMCGRCSLDPRTGTARCAGP